MLKDLPKEFIFMVQWVRARLKTLKLILNLGCGKTMLMDLFAEMMPTKRKDRIHFHIFMQNFHKGIFIFKVLILF